jgi:hypothetical protein
MRFPLKEVRETKGLLAVVLGLAILALVVWLAVKLYDTIKGMFGSLNEFLGGNVPAKAAAVVSVLNPFSPTDEAVESLIGPAPLNAPDRQYVYDPSLDSRSWFDRLFSLPPASSFRVADTSLTGMDNSTGGKL